MKKNTETVVKKDQFIPTPYEGLFWPLMQLDKIISGTRNTLRRRAGDGEATLRDARRPPAGQRPAYMTAREGAKRARLLRKQTAAGCIARISPARIRLSSRRRMQWGASV